MQFFDELNIEGFDFTNGFKCSDMHGFEKLNNLSIKIFEINFHQDGDKWKHNLIPIEISKKNQILLLTYYYTKIIMLSLKNSMCF